MLLGYGDLKISNDPDLPFGLVLNDNSSKTTEAALLLFGRNVAWVRTIQRFFSLPLGLVAMATESSHRLIMGKWLNYIFSITSEMM